MLVVCWGENPESNFKKHISYSSSQKEKKEYLVTYDRDGGGSQTTVNHRLAFFVLIVACS